MKLLLNNRKKFLILLCTIVLVSLCLNSNNIYKYIKAEVNGVNTSSQLTEEKIKNMKAGSILGEIISTHENGYEYISFYDDNENETKYAKLIIENASPKIYKVKVILRFNSNVEKKTAKITLKEGIEFSDYGTTTLVNDLEEFIPNTKANNLLGTSYSTNNGTATYKFKSGIEYVTINFEIKPDIVLDMGEIKKAITVNLYENEEIKSSSYLNVDADMSNHPIMINGTNFTDNRAVYGSEYSSYPNSRVAGFYTYNESLGGSRNCLFEYIRITYEVPNNVEFKDTISITGGATSSTIKMDLNEELSSNNTYVFEKKNFYGSFAGINAAWAFPSNLFKSGDKVEVKVTKLEYKTYNGDVVSTDGKYFVYNSTTGKAKEKNGDFSYTVTYTILQDENIEFSKTNEANVYSVNKEKLDKEAMLGYFHFINNSSVQSKNKDIIYYFSDEVGISEINVPIFDIKEGFINVYYKTNNNDSNWKGPVKLSYDKEASEKKQFLIDKDDLGLNSNEYISSLKYNVGIIPGNFNELEPLNLHSYYGRVRSNSVAPSSYNAIIHVVNAGTNKTDLSKCEENEKDCHKRIYNFNYDTKYLNIFFEPNQTKIIEAGSVQKFEYILQHNISSTYFKDSFVYNPIIYVRDETGLGLTNFKLKTYDEENKAIDFTNETIIELIKTEEDGTLVYKIDTKNVRNDKALVGYYGHRMKNHAKRIYLSYDLNIPATYTDGGKLHNFKDAVFATTSDFDYVNNHISFNAGDPYDVDGDGITNDDVMTFMKTSSYYKIDAALDINAIVEQKEESDLEYVYWQKSEHDLSINENQFADLKLTIKNDSGVNASKVIIYFPIPKEGQNWGILSNNEAFKFSMNLVDLSELNSLSDSKLEISYGIIEPTNNLENLNGVANWENVPKIQNLSLYNIIRISIDNFDYDKEKTFRIKLSLSDKQKLKQRQQFSFAIYRNLTTKDNQVISSYKYGNIVGISTLLPMYNLTTIYKDIYNDELDKRIEKKEYNTQYETIAKEINGYELFLEPKNKNGIILNDTIVEYVYKSLEERKVIIHYYEEKTKNKLKEDKIITGKDLEQFEIRPIKIEGYDLVEDKIIKGAFKKNIQEFEYYYRKKEVVLSNPPSTGDTISTYVLLFVLSIVSIVSVLIYVKKKMDN